MSAGIVAVKTLVIEAVSNTPVSERTVSRYLPHRLTTPSQTWRTFLANHIGNLAFVSTVTSSCATGNNYVDASVLSVPAVLPSPDGRYASTQWALVR
jgi:hypothetical protein